MAEHRSPRAAGRPGGRTAEPTVADLWHVVRQDQHAALCGRVLAWNGPTLSVDQVGAVTSEEICPACWAWYQELP